jgi:uncharacterized protein YjiS (DUF1127 family)
MPQTISNTSQQCIGDTAPLSSAFPGARKMLRSLLAYVRQEARIRLEIAKAQALDDHILADIAVERREIRSAVRGGRWGIEKIVNDD